MRLLDAHTLLVMGTALLVALFFLLPGVHTNFLGYIFYRGLTIGDVLFHEMGHAITSWLFGRPAIPSILTIFGSDKAGGLTPYWPHSWPVQAFVWAGLAYGCYYLQQERPQWFIPALIGTLLLVALSFTPYPPLLRAYMGHGSAILCGGVLLYRAWSNIIVRNGWERWCNALFGFFIVLNNAIFAYQLGYSPSFRARYDEAGLTMDFVQITDFMPHWRVEGIASFTLILCAVTLILSFALAAYFYEDEHYEDA